MRVRYSIPHHCTTIYLDHTTGNFVSIIKLISHWYIEFETRNIPGCHYRNLITLLLILCLDWCYLDWHSFCLSNFKAAVRKIKACKVAQKTEEIDTANKFKVPSGVKKDKCFLWIRKWSKVLRCSHILEMVAC